MELRKIAIFVDDVLSEGGRKLLSPTRRVAACGVIRNPFAGKPPIDDFSELVDISVDAGEVLTSEPWRFWEKLNLAPTAKVRLLAPQGTWSRVLR